MKTKTTPKIKIVKICKQDEEFVQKLERVKLKNQDVRDFRYAGYTLQLAFLGALKL
jgi:hypothetical protein